MKQSASTTGINIRANVVLCAALCALLAPALIAAAQTAETSAHPNLQGYWVSQERGPGGPPGAGGPPPGGRGPPRAGGPPPGGPRGGGGGARPQPSDAGIAAARGYEQPFDDPAIKCDIANIIFGWTHDQNINEIVQAKDSITFKYGYMDFVRTVHMDMSAHPANLPRTRGGHSTGKWEGDTLVVDTIGLAPSVLIPINGVMLSEQAHIVERFTLDPTGRALTRAYVVEDPLYLREAFSGRDVMAASTEPYTPYECVELSGDNNKRPVK